VFFPFLGVGIFLFVCAPTFLRFVFLKFKFLKDESGHRIYSNKTTPGSPL
jgi:hypothetical protein